MKAVIQPLAWGVATASMLAIATSLALGFTAGTIQAAEHAHGHQDHSEQPLQLPADGHKWATDAGLREGMTRVREAMPQGATTEPLGTNEAAKLQAATQSAVAYMVEHCELTAEADAALHGLLAEQIRGADALSHAESREAGLALIASALQRYSDVFAEPLWR